MKSFNELLKKSIALAAAGAAAVSMSVSVFAEDFELDVSGAKQSTGAYGQSLTYYTCLGDPDGAADNFDPTLMTSDSEVFIEYELEGEYVTGDDGYISAAPVQLIWQSWKGGIANSEEDKWIQVTPYEFDETSARFSFDDIAAAYGTEDFSNVYAINVGDTGVKLTVTGMSITNISSGEAAETEVTESKAVEVSLTTAAIVENAPVETNAAPMVMGIVVGVAVAAVIVVVVVLMLKANKRKNY